MRLIINIEQSAMMNNICYVIYFFFLRNLTQLEELFK